MSSVPYYKKGYSNDVPYTAYDDDDDAVLLMQKRNGHVYFRMNSMRSKILYGWIDRLLAFEMRSPLFVSSLWLMLKLELSVGWVRFDSRFLHLIGFLLCFESNDFITKGMNKAIWMMSGVELCGWLNVQLIMRFWLVNKT